MRLALGGDRDCKERKDFKQYCVAADLNLRCGLFVGLAYRVERMVADFVFPCICTGAMLAVVILSRVLRMPDKDYIISLIVCAVMGVFPLIFFFRCVAGYHSLCSMCSCQFN